MKGFIHVCKVKEKLNRHLGKFDVGKLNAPIIR